MKKRELSLLVTSILAGILIFMQGKAFSGVDQAARRESRTDIFREIQILKNTNDNLDDEVKELEDKFSKMSNQGNALQVVADEIEKYRLLNGQVSIMGPGIRLTIDGDLKAIWLTDIANELFSAGAEAVSINGIRITESNAGFDTIPNGQIMINSVIIKSPYDIEAIGERKTLADALSQPQGIIQRMKENLRDVSTNLLQKDLVSMEKVI